MNEPSERVPGKQLLTPADWKKIGREPSRSRLDWKRSRSSVFSVSVSVAAAPKELVDSPPTRRPVTWFFHWPSKS